MKWAISLFLFTACYTSYCYAITHATFSKKDANFFALLIKEKSYSNHLTFKKIPATIKMYDKRRIDEAEQN